MRAVGLFLGWLVFYTLDMVGTTVIVYGIGRYVFGFWS